MSKDLVPAPSQTRPQTPADVLRAAALRIEPNGRWTQGTFARNKRGEGVLWHARTACSFCIDGALMMVAGDGDLAASAFGALTRSLGGTTPIEWNDAPERTQAEVVAKLREVADSLDPPPANPEIGGEG